MNYWKRLFGNSLKNGDTSPDSPAAPVLAGQQSIPRPERTGATAPIARDLPFSELGQFEVHEASVRLLDYRFCLENYVVVLGVVDGNAGEPVTVGMLHPEDPVKVLQVADQLKREIHPVGLNAHEIIDSVDLGYGLYGKILQTHPAEHQLSAVTSISLEPHIPVTVIVDDILGYAVHRGASDIHIESYEDDVDVRLRIDGIMSQVRNSLNPDNVRQAVQRLKVLARLDVTERNRAQDGRITTEYHDQDGNEKEIDFRLSVLPGPYGEDAVLRVLGDNTIIEMEQLGFTDDDLHKFSMLTENPEGLILVTGPTGSGKTTTLYSAVNRIKTVEKKIITVEDPIEAQFDKVNQKEVSVHMGFADFTRAFMRQNPDIILVGEIRDTDTAQTAIRAANTGHLVLSTLHTIDSTRAITRLESLGVDPDLIASTVIGVLSQRLARKICAKCREETPPDALQQKRLGIAPDDGPFFTGAGCETCFGSGLKGRTGIYELFIPDAEVADMLARDTPIHQVREYALANGMQSLYQYAMARARSGLIPLSEIQRVIPYRMIVEK